MESEAQVIEAPPTVTEKKLSVITLKILPILKQRQQQNGLRYGHYLRYHGYCSRRLRRLRESLRMPQGDRRHFKKKNVTLLDIDSEKGDSRYLEIPLTLSERAWAYAMALKEDANTEPRKRFHSVCRMQKAKDHAETLFNLANESERVDARTKLESEAYYAFMNATFFFELQNWSEAFQHFKKAHSIYTNIRQSLGNDDPEISIYTEKVTEFMPSMRYCAHQTREKVDFTEFTAEFKSAPVEDLMAKKLEMSNIVPQVAVTEKPKAPMQQIPIPARVPVLEGQIAEKLEATPMKPLFFDLAGHGIKLPLDEVKEKVHKLTHGEDSPKKSGAKGESAGLSGFVKGLWGWGK